MVRRQCPGSMAEAFKGCPLSTKKRLRQRKPGYEVFYAAALSEVRVVPYRPPPQFQPRAFIARDRHTSLIASGLSFQGVVMLFFLGGWRIMFPGENRGGKWSRSQRKRFAANSSQAMQFRCIRFQVSCIRRMAEPPLNARCPGICVSAASPSRSRFKLLHFDRTGVARGVASHVGVMRMVATRSSEGRID